MLVVACLCAAHALATTPYPKSHADATRDRVLHDLCGKQIVLLGESPSHGFGRTMRYKSELVQALVDGCHFNAVFFESGVYDFLNIQRELASGHEVTEKAIAAAIGGLWANRDVAPLIPFLTQRVLQGKLVLGGIDDQLGRGTYAQNNMPSDLVQHLEGETKARCLAILQKHTLWQYSQGSPYGPRDKALILGCLDAMEAQLGASEPGEAQFRGAERADIDSLKRSFARDFREDDHSGIDPNVQLFNERDASMYRNFQWLMSRLPAHSKVIVWSATTHIAKNLSEVPGQQGRVPFGSYVARDFERRVFALGFSAYSGTYAMGRQPPKQLTAASGNSLEGRAFVTNPRDTRYYNPNDLRKMGFIAARPLGTDFKTANWTHIFDGILVFREERPPETSKE